MAPMLASASANAQTIDHASADSSSASSGAEAYREALELHEAGDLKGSLRKMQEAHQLSQRAELFYNIARIEGELGDCRASLADYRRYLELVPEGRYRSVAEDASSRLSVECPDPAAPGPAAAAAMVPASQPAPAPPASERADSATAARPSEPAPYWTPPRIIGWSAVAAGAVAGATAVLFTLSAHDARDRYKQSVDHAYSTGNPADIDRSFETEYQREARWARALGITSGVLAAGGILVLILTPSSQGGNATTARLYLQPGLLAATYAQAF
jgi:hypothetical protein